MERGCLIVLEGLDGAGKTTQLSLLRDWLLAQGKRVFCTAEPTDSETGRMLRDALSGKTPRTACELAALFTLDRIGHNVDPDRGIARMIRDGYVVLCDRYYYSSLAYQGAETDADWVRNMNLNCPEIRRPDLCIFLDLSPEESIRRITRGRESLEIFERQDRLERIREQFRAVLASLPDETVRVIDASRSPEEVREDVCRACAEFFKAE